MPALGARGPPPVRPLATLGLATGRTPAELRRERFPRQVALGLWAQAEVMAMRSHLQLRQRLCARVRNADPQRVQRFVINRCGWRTNRDE
jgi:hypothetical protein